jgi:hypothetical protein
MDAKEFSAVSQQFYATCRQDPRQAIADLRRFLGQRAADLGEAQTRFFYQLLAQTYATSLKDTEAALAVLEEGSHKLPPDSEEQVSLLDTKANVLLGAGRQEEAQSLLEAEWPRVVAGNRTRLLLNTYITVLNLRGQDAKALEILRQMAIERLEHLSDNFPPPHLKLLLDQLVRQGQSAQAESWAKLFVLLCSYNESSLRTATQWLMGVWTAKYSSPAKVAELATALQNAGTPGPLHAVKLPSLDAAVLTRHLGAASLSPQRVVLLLALGRDRDAMLAARSLMLDQPQTNAGILEACRVFKAHDQNLQRANAFLEYCKSGQGENPVEAFLKETATK